MKHRPNKIGIVGLGFVLSLLASTLRAEPIAVVVNANWDEAKEVSIADLRAVYLGRRTRLFGRPVSRIDLASGSAARSGFSASVLGRSETALERYWIEQALSGGAIPPFQVAEHADVLRYVRERKGSIGYVPLLAMKNTGAQGVRVLGVLTDGVPRQPGDNGYPIQTMK